jgi:hypothetical protein
MTMAKANINAGICGFSTTVIAEAEGMRKCAVKIASDCQHIQNLAEQLTEVDPMQEISFRRGTPKTMELAAEYCAHAACPVPAGIIKTIEVACNLALPADAEIKINK